jgi:tetraacyldisaccharide 4'-kinase
MNSFSCFIHKVIHRVSELIQRQWWRDQPSILTWLLSPLSGLYVLLQKCHQASEMASIPEHLSNPPLKHVVTLVVGNVVVGGAGKTPMTLALLHWLKAQGWKPGVISRGYGRAASHQTTPIFLSPDSSAYEVGDEPLLIYQRTGVPVVVARDRVAARQALLSAYPEVNVVVADDGLQHYRLTRDLSVIVVDERGWGNGWCLPAGPLRQPVGMHPPANSLVVYTGGVVTCGWPGFLGHRSMAAPMLLPHWLSQENSVPASGWNALQGRPIHAVAGIAVPERFFQGLRRQGLQIEPLALPDHFDYAHWVWPDHATDVIMTEKDAVKLAPKYLDLVAQRGGADLSPRFWVVPLAFEVELDFWNVLHERLMLHG